MKTKGAGVQNEISCDFGFDGGLQSHNRAALVKEIAKYLLYDRQQIPLPIEHIKRELKSVGEPQGTNEDGLKNGLKEKRKRHYNRLELKRATCALDNFEEICDHLTSAFEICPEIKQVLIVFGGTVISPKESYLITFPSPNLDDEIMSVKASTRALLKQLIMKDMHGETKAITPTNMNILLYAPRESGVTGFHPKPNFKIPTRGKQFTLNMTCKSKSSVSSQDLSRDEREVEISGIEPFDIEMSDLDSTQDLSFTPGGHLSAHCLSNAGGETTPTSSSLHCYDADLCKSFDNKENSYHSVGEVNHSETEIEHIWFQAPCFVKGYRDRSSRHASLLT